MFEFGDDVEAEEMHERHPLMKTRDRRSELSQAFQTGSGPRGRWKQIMVCGLLLVAGCGLDLATSEDARSVFFDRVGSLCEQEWAGVTELAPASDEIFRPSPLTLHLEECGESELRFRFGVDGDLTRSWLLRLEENGSLLFLQGRGDPALGMKAGESWGGWATNDGTTLFQHFPDYRTSHAQNPGRGPRIWRLQIDTLTHGLIYHLDQGDKARFRLVFEPVSETGP